MKILCALAFVLSSFAAANAQTLDASMIVAYYLDDCLEVVTEQSTEPARIVPAEPTTAKLDETETVATSAADVAEDAPVGARQPGTEAQSEPPVDDTVEQSTTAASIIATEPTIEELGETQDVATTAADVAEDASVGATQRGTEAQSEPPVDDTVEHSTTAARVIATEPATEKLGETQGVATTAADVAEDTSVGAAAPADEAPGVEHSTQGYEPAVNDTIEQSTAPVVIVATAPPVEALGEADSVAATPADDAEDSSAEAIGPSAEAQMLDETIALIDDRLVLSSD